MKTLIVIALIGLASLRTSSQSLPKDLLFSYEIESKLAKGDIDVSLASYLYAQIGDYNAAMNTYDIPLSWGIDTVSMVDYSIIPALDKIVEIARNKEIVIISESHLKPQHRIFSAQIIKALAKYGFQHLGMEALYTKAGSDEMILDTLLNDRGYPLNTIANGFYLREQNMARLIEYSIIAGYTLFGYERAERVAGKDRDEIQADNIISYMNRNQVKKIIIHCGWHHAVESNLQKGKNNFWLAKYLKDKTGLDPLTIYQDNFTEKITENQHAMLDTLNISEPSLFIDKDGEVSRLTEEVDIEVIHPVTHYINGRPKWLYGKDKVAYQIDMDSLTIAFPMFAKVYHLGDSKDSVPVDIIELKQKFDRKSLVLERGKYLLVLDNKSEIKEFEIAID